MITTTLHRTFCEHLPKFAYIVRLCHSHKTFPLNPCFSRPEKCISSKPLFINQRDRLLTLSSYAWSWQCLRAQTRTGKKEAQKGPVDARDLYYLIGFQQQTGHFSGRSRRPVSFVLSPSSSQFSVSPRHECKGQWHRLTIISAFCESPSQHLLTGSSLILPACSFRKQFYCPRRDNTQFSYEPDEDPHATWLHAEWIPVPCEDQSPWKSTLRNYTRT